MGLKQIKIHWKVGDPSGCTQVHGTAVINWLGFRLRNRVIPGQAFYWLRWHGLWFVAQYDQISPIGGGPRMDIGPFGMNDIEWLNILPWWQIISRHDLVFPCWMKVKIKMEFSMIYTCGLKSWQINFLSCWSYFHHFRDSSSIKHLFCGLIFRQHRQSIMKSSGIQRNVILALWNHSNLPWIYLIGCRCRTNEDMMVCWRSA